MNKSFSILTQAIVFLFAVSATAQTKVVVIPLTGKTLAGVAKTGQTTSYVARDDGALQKGVTWPNPRFTDNNNGAVTDNLTGLIWLKNANCYGVQNWSAAFTAINSLANGFCGLTDGSKAGEWRLPNRKELASLLDFAYYGPPLSNNSGTGQWTSGVGSAFSDVQAGFYWSSTTYAGNTAYAWSVDLFSGNANSNHKGVVLDVWPVRD